MKETEKHRKKLNEEAEILFRIFAITDKLAEIYI